MRKIIYWVQTSIDGFIDGPNGELDWPGPELSAYSETLDQRADTLLFGRRVWEMMIGYRPRAESVCDDPQVAEFAPYWRATPKNAFSRTHPGEEWTDRVVKDDIRAQVGALKAAPGADLLLTGGADLAATLTELGLIDEYHIAVHPVALGGGRKVFAHPEHRVNLRVVSSRVLDGSVVVTHYAPDMQ
ncbi:MAG: dihydrofolate reductase [Catenulispora sp.]|nr:dihydrofolate reductase [Catenulispora sp.]